MVMGRYVFEPGESNRAKIIWPGEAKPGRIKIRANQNPGESNRAKQTGRIEPGESNRANQTGRIETRANQTSFPPAEPASRVNFHPTDISLLSPQVTKYKFSII